MNNNMEWRPIESAPKDGTGVLLYGMPSEHAGVSWQKATVLSGYYDKLDGAWCSTTSAWDGPFVKPTHWMPLPPAPKAK